MHVEETNEIYYYSSRYIWIFTHKKALPLLKICIKFSTCSCVDCTQQNDMVLQQMV